MAEYRERSVESCAEWLHNKLSGEDMWSAGAISSMLTRDTLINTAQCFAGLDSTVKLKVLLALLSVSKLDQVQQEVTAVLEAAREDKDEWVRVIYDIIKGYPQRQLLNVSTLANISPALAKAIQQISRTCECH